MSQSETTAIATSIEEAASMAKADEGVLAAGGFVVAKVDGGYGYFATPTPQGNLTDLLGPASGKTGEIVQRQAYKGGSWMPVGLIEENAHFARERLPETELGNTPP